MRKFTHKEETQLKNLLSRGMTLKMLSKKIGRTQVDTAEYLKKYSLMETYERELLNTEVINTAHLNGLTADKIAQQHNFTPEYVQARLKAISENEVGELKPLDSINYRNNYGWTLEEDVLLAYLNDEKEYSIGKIANLLKRSEKAVTVRQYHRRVGKLKTAYDPENEEHLAIIINWEDAQKPQSEMHPIDQIIYEASLGESILDENNVIIHPATEDMFGEGVYDDTETEDRMTEEQLLNYFIGTGRRFFYVLEK